eukprot:g441.t1
MALGPALKDGCGLATAGMTNFFLFGSAFVLNFYTLRPWLGTLIGSLHSVIVTHLLILGAISQWQAMLTDPGAVPKDARPPIKKAVRRSADPSVCRKCGVFKPIRAHHDRISKRCIVKMDHYCPWVNNVVGFNNHKYFLLFLGYVFSGCLYALGLIVWFHMHKSACRHKSCQVKLSITGEVLTLLVTVLALLFGMFTLGMFCEQMYSICTSTTKIDRLKGNYRFEDAEASPHSSSTSDSLVDTFGSGKFTIRWLLPVSPEWNDLEKRLGYYSPSALSGVELSAV